MIRLDRGSCILSSVQNNQVDDKNRDHPHDFMHIPTLFELEQSQIWKKEGEGSLSVMEMMLKAVHCSGGPVDQIKRKSLMGS